MLKSVYSLRLKGEQHLEGYNFQRTMDELIEGLNDMITITDLEIKRVLDKKEGRGLYLDH